MKRILYALALIMISLSTAFAQGSPTAGGSGSGTTIQPASTGSNAGIASLQSGFCNIVFDVRSVIGILVLLLFVFGAIMYAVGHFLPQAANLRSGAQSWGLGMIIGGTVGLILVLIAPYIISMVISFSGQTSVSIPTC